MGDLSDFMCSNKASDILSQTMNEDKLSILPSNYGTISNGEREETVLNIGSFLRNNKCMDTHTRLREDEQSILVYLNNIISLWIFYVFMILVLFFDAAVWIFAAIVMRESQSAIGRAMASLEDACIEDNVRSDLSSSISKSNPSWNDGNSQVNAHLFDEIFCDKSRCAQLILLCILLSIACANVCKDVVDIGVLISARTRSRLKCFKKIFYVLFVFILSRLEIGLFDLMQELFFYQDKQAFL